MIIHRIKAKNVLKYTSLDLKDLPERGLIAITGPNESGKSTIGETLCFALFGRTFSLDYDGLEKVIHWGETHCSVEVDFTASDGNKYTLDRFLDDSGNHSARLIKLGAAKDEEPLARGVEKVADLVYQLIGYEFEEFIESFYLAQREITTPHPHSYAVKTMAGLVTLEYSAAAFRDEVEGTAAAMQETRKEAANLAAQIEEFELDPACLPGLETERADYTARLGDTNHQLSVLDQASIEYQDALPKRESALRARGTAGFFRFVFLLLALLSGGAWVLLTKLPEHQYAVELNNLLASVIPDWGPGMVIWLLYGAAGLLLPFILFWVRRSSQNSQLQQLAEAGRELSATLDSLETEHCCCRPKQSRRRLTRRIKSSRTQRRLRQPRSRLSKRSIAPPASGSVKGWRIFRPILPKSGKESARSRICSGKSSAGCRNDWLSWTERSPRSSPGSKEWRLWIPCSMICWRRMMNASITSIVADSPES